MLGDTPALQTEMVSGGVTQGGGRGGRSIGSWEILWFEYLSSLPAGGP